MSPSEIKELLSRNQFKTIANRCGYKCEKPGDGDHGVDFHVHEVAVVQRPQGTRIFDTGRILPFQLKATTEHSVEINGDELKFDLESKTFNDLVERLASHFPLTLVLAVLPEDQSRWLRCGEDHLNQFTKLYWYRPPAEAEPTDNAHSKRIQIPLANRVDLGFLGTQFTELFA